MLLVWNRAGTTGMATINTANHAMQGLLICTIELELIDRSKVQSMKKFTLSSL